MGIIYDNTLYGPSIKALKEDSIECRKILDASLNDIYLEDTVTNIMMLQRIEANERAIILLEKHNKKIK